MCILYGDLGEECAWDAYTAAPAYGVMKLTCRYEARNRYPSYSFAHPSSYAPKIHNSSNNAKSMNALELDLFKGTLGPCEKVTTWLTSV